MLCSYDCCQSENTETRSCDRCMSGIMVLVSIIAGIVFAAIFVLLFVNSLLTAPFTGILVSLITAIVFMFIVLIASYASKNDARLKNCIRCNAAVVFIGILGTIAAGILAVSVELVVGSILSAVLIGLTAFFFAYMLISILFSVICMTD